MRRQLHALRDALALAVVLNRTLVLPQFDCVCDRSELVVSRLAYLCVAPTHDEARAELDAMLLTRGVPEAKLEAARANFHWGDPDEVAEEMAIQMALGLDGFCVNSLANCWIPGRIELLGETLRRVVDA